MRLFLLDWFGWSFLWLLPLCGRVVLSLLAGRGLRGRGAIRIWLGTLLVLCASSALEALLRSQGDNALQSDFIGQALARNLGHAGGKLLTPIIFLATSLLGLFWLFGRPRQSVADDEPTLPLQTALPRRTPLHQPLAGKHFPAAANPVVNPPKVATPAPVVTPFDYLQRKRDPWPLPNALQRTASSSRPLGAKWPPLPPQQHTQKRPARPASEWASFESLRPTEAMLARSATQTPTPVKPTPTSVQRTSSATPGSAATVGNQTKVRISTSSDRSNAITTSLRTALQAREPQAAPVAATPAPLPLAPILMPVPAPAVLHTASLSTALPAEIVAARAIAPTPTIEQIFSVIDTPATLPITPPTEVAAPATPPVPMQIRSWTPSVSTPPSIVAETAIPYRRSDIPLPGIELLDQGSDVPVEMDANELLEIGQLIEQRLKEFKVPVTVLGAYAGPVITRFEIEPALGVRGAQIVNLMKDLARALGLTSIRVVETIPGKTCMGLELPNPKRQMIRLAEIIQSDAYTHSASHLTLAMGKDITGIPIATDLARAPHMLVAGTTGSGKSVAINAMILSLLYKATPDDVRLIMIDPKMLELSVYDGIPHLLAPVVTDMKLAAHALSWCVAEMDKRYRLMSTLGVRNLAGYNQKIRDGIAAEKRVKNPFSLTPDAPEPLEPLPMIVVVIDELADLMMVAGKKIEELIARLAQKARAAGIHLILATQRPSVDVITGLIKANIPTRVAFQVSSKIDSRTVLDQMGAETLLGHGDMLFLPPGSGYPQRVHGAFVSDEEVHRVVEHLKAHGEPQYEEAILAGPASEEAQQGEIFGDAGEETDQLYDEAVAYVTRSRRASISSVQRQFRIGYNRAARLVEQMEAAGILSSMSKSGSRDVLAPPPQDL